MGQQNHGAGVPPGVHFACYLILAAIFLYAAVEHCRRPFTFRDQPPVESDRIAQIQNRIDPNKATWDELARLPGIGESLAREIVAYREGKRAYLGPTNAAQTIVFKSIGDLDPIPGLGEKLLHQIQQHLIFPP